MAPIIKKLNFRFCLYLILCTVSIYFAANRLWLETRDTENYLNSFRGFTEFDVFSNEFEPGFTLIIWLVKLLNWNEWLFLLLVACLGVGLKFFAIIKYAPYIYLSLLVYYAKYYLLHEMVQLRVGIAAGLFLIGIKYIKQRQFSYFCLCVGLSALFHYSAILYMLVYLFCTQKISNRNFFLSIISITFLMLALNLDEYIFSWLAMRVEKVQVYINGLEEGVQADINILNVEYLLKIGLFLMMYSNQERLKKHLPYFDIWIRTIGLSIIFFFALRSIPVLAFRISELFDVVVIFVLPSMIFLFKERLFGYFLYGALVVGIFYNSYVVQMVIFS